ncbi:hypothetical protein Mycsm_01129 [Mycobacterium sp. JS623]|nr:hypothetical protein Mycsm_01129 [Mycobacterium sp. JS623]
MVCTVVCTSVSVLVTVLGTTVTVSVSTGAWAAPPPLDPPDESCFSWWPPPEAAAEVVVVVVVVLVVAVGAGVPVELHATDSAPTATAVTPTVRDARLEIWAVINDNGLSLSSQSDYVTARYIPTGRRAPGNRAADGCLRTACC